MNPFRQQVGIYYKDREWASDLFDQIVEMAGPEILKADKSTHNMYIVFSDNSVVILVPADISARGYRFSTSYIQKGIDRKVYEVVIAPKTLNNQCYMFESLDDIYPYAYKEPAQSYYRKQVENE